MSARLLTRRSMLSLLAGAILVANVSAADPVNKGYPLTPNPLKLLDGLAELRLGMEPAPVAADRALLEQVWTLKVEKQFATLQADDKTLVDAILIACDVAADDKRKAVRERLDAITTAAREAIQKGTTPVERGELLLQHLHKTVLHGGYLAEQSSLVTALESNKCNTVSAAALYHLIGTRLGLALRAHALPATHERAGQASLDLLDGDRRIQIEAANPNGFDWQKKTSLPGVLVVGVVADRRQVREVDGLGLAALMAANRAVALASEKPPQWPGASRWALLSLALNPTGDTAHQVLAVLATRGAALSATEKQRDEAVRLLDFALTAAPKAGEVRGPHVALRTEHILALVRVSKDREAVAAVASANKALPGEDEFRAESVWFARVGEELLDRSDWEGCMALVERGLAVIRESEGTRLKEWRSGAFRRWSQTLLMAGDAAGSLKVLARAYQLNPKDAEIHTGIAYHTQEAMKLAEAKSGLADALTLYKTMREQFPEAKEIAEVGAVYGRRKVASLAEQKMFAEALKLADKLTPNLLDAEARIAAGVNVYDHWATALVADGKLEAVLDKYTEAMKLYPKQTRLENNALAIVDTFAAKPIEAARWEEAIALYKIGLRYFPGNMHLKTNLAFCERKAKTK